MEDHDILCDMVLEVFDGNVQQGYGTNPPYFDNETVIRSQQGYLTYMMLTPTLFLSVGLHRQKHPEKAMNIFEVTFRHASSPEEAISSPSFDRSGSGIALTTFNSVMFMVTEIIKNTNDVNAICFTAADERLETFYERMIRSSGFQKSMNEVGFRYDGMVDMTPGPLFRPITQLKTRKVAFSFIR